MAILVTGGSGFIGGNFVRNWLNDSNEQSVILNKLIYAGSHRSLASLKGENRYVTSMTISAHSSCESIAGRISATRRYCSFLKSHVCGMNTHLSNKMPIIEIFERRVRG
jgi:dTDP-D-glucose 4,6-dehydratase